MLLLNKPVGVVSSLVRQDQRSCLLDLLPEEHRVTRLFHVGRLDQDSSGLILLSDDGDLAHALLSPVPACVQDLPASAYGRIWTRVSWNAWPTEALCSNGRPVAPAKVRPITEPGGRVVVEVALREGRNRQLRRMVEAVGARVRELQRIGFGPLVLGELPEGQLREATAEEYQSLHALLPARD